MKKNIVKNIASMILIFLGACIIAGVNYINNNFDNINFAEIIFNLKDGAFTAGKSIVSTTIIRMVIDIILWIFIFLLPYIISHITHKHLEYIDKNNKGHPLFKNHLCLYSFIVFFISLIYAVIGFNIIDYIKSKNTYSDFINDNYVAPTRSNVTFNGTKHNLIYIYLESMESSYADKNSGGLKDSNLIPNLTNLAKDNINFSNTNNLGGAYQLDTLGWTTAGLIASTAGLPLKNDNLSDHDIKNNSFGNVTILSDILYQNGYNNEFIMGSDADFGDRGNYLTNHNYNIFDYHTAINKGLISSDYYVWWGFEDSKLFDYAKTELNNLSTQDKPFYLSLLTTDTHFFDGYLESDCPTNFSDDYSNAIYCSDLYVYNFIKWIQQQPFYDNTTIVISGDHLTMQSDFFDKNDDSKRTVYNVFINSAIKTDKTNERQFTTMDMFPTTLASIGANIDGDRLGLGTNLFSTKKTLFEEYGLEYLNAEINKESAFYNEKIINNR